MRKPPEREAFQPQNYGETPPAQESKPGEAQKNCALSSTRLSLYAGVSPEIAGSAALSEVANRIREDDRLRKATEKLRQLGSEAARREKNSLPSTTFAGEFSYRANDRLSSYSGLIVLDFDHLSAHGRRAGELRDEIAAHPSCALAFVSPKADGVKAVFALDAAGLDLSDLDAVQAFHARAYEAVRADCETRYGVPLDVSGKDPARLCFLCHDAQAAYNPEPEPFAVPPEPEPAAQSGRAGKFPAPGRPLPPVPFASPANQTRAMADVARLCGWAAETGTDVTAGYDDWYRIALALARAARRGELPEDFAAEAFQSLSANHPAYSHAECARKFAGALRDADARPGGVTLGTVFYIAKNHGYVRQRQTPADGANAGQTVRVGRYASEALDRIASELAPGVRLLLQAPTGTGKTKAVFDLARRLTGAKAFARVWVLAPYARLAEQMAGEYAVPGVWGGVTGDDVRAARMSDVLVATYDGLAKLGGVPAGTLLVVDECHELADAQGYRAKALKLVARAADDAQTGGGAVLYATATPGEFFADAFGLYVLTVVPDRVSRKEAAFCRSGKWTERKRACFALLAEKAAAAPDRLFVLFCNSKRALGQAGRFLESAGLPAGAVVRVTANDDGDAVRSLLASGRFPSGVRVVLASKALGAGYNVLNENVGGVFLLPNGNEGLRPNDAAQFTARFRNADGLRVYVFAGEPNPDARDSKKGMRELLRTELWKGDQAVEARRGVDLTDVDDRLPAVRLDGNARAVERENDPDSGLRLCKNVHYAYFLASERRNRARTPDDYATRWREYDPGVSFAERPGAEPDGETAALLQRIEDEQREAENAARETVASWTAAHAMAVGYACIPRLRREMRRYDPGAKEAAADVSAGDKERFLAAGGPAAARRILGTVPELPGFPAARLWTRCVSEGNPTKWAAWKTSVAVALHAERKDGRLGDAALCDGLKAADFALWEKYGLIETERLVKGQGDGLNLKEAYGTVAAVLKKRGFALSWHAFRQVLAPLYFQIGKEVRLVRDDGGRVRIRRLERLEPAQSRERFAAAFGLEYAEYEHLIQRLKSERDGVAKAAAGQKEAEQRADGERAAKDAQPLPVPVMAARFGADNSTDAVTFANDPPDAEPCPY